MVAMFFLLMNGAFAAPVRTLKVESLSRTYTLVLDDKNLLFRSGAGNFFIKRTTCNEQMITAFWTEGSEEIKRFPKIKGGTLRPAATIDGQRHLLRSLRSPASINNLDKKFYSLQIQARLKCK